MLRSTRGILSWILLSGLSLSACKVDLKSRLTSACVADCPDAAVSETPVVFPPPSSVLDPRQDGGANLLPECLGACNPDTPEALECATSAAPSGSGAASGSAQSSGVQSNGAQSNGAQSNAAAPNTSGVVAPADFQRLSVRADAATFPTPQPGTASDGGHPDAGHANGGDWDASDGADAGGFTPWDGSTAPPAVPDAGKPGASDAEAEGGAGLGVVTSEAGVPEETSPVLACQVAPDVQGVLHSVCAPSGTGQERSPCASSRDCLPGLACVEGGQCLPFCCGGQSSCGSESYCARKKLRGVAEVLGQSSLVPVCAPGERCQLGEPFPCPKGRVCSCSDGNACTIVDANGTRACVAPGKGTQGEDCPCAAGYVCSQSTQSCLKLCQLQENGACGADKVCQPGPDSYPEGWGLCVAAF